jgi:hypothetical protein
LLACSSIQFCFSCASSSSSSSSSSFCFLAPSFLPLHYYTARNFHHPEIVVIAHENTAFLGVRGRRVTYSNYETLNTNHLGTHSQWKFDEKTWEKRKKQTKSTIAQRKSAPNIIMAAAYIVFPITDLQKLQSWGK